MKKKRPVGRIVGTSLTFVFFVFFRVRFPEKAVFHRAQGSSYSPSYHFATFAFTSKEAGGRWSSASCRKALQIMYSSLVKSQEQFPRLHVFTDENTVIPVATLNGGPVNIVAHHTNPGMLPKNSYSKSSPWKSLSRAKLDVVEDLITTFKTKIVWIDLDTLVFVDLGVTESLPWVVGYQNGGCQGAKNCSWEHIARGGRFSQDIEPKFDALGDLWTLDLNAIRAIKTYEQQHTRSGLPLPEYDLQGYFTLMLQDSALPVALVHDLLDFNFGFFCSNFQHPSTTNLQLRLENSHIVCPKREGVSMGARVGAISFTALTFQKLLLRDSTIELSWVTDDRVRAWLHDWFFT